MSSSSLVLSSHLYEGQEKSVVVAHIELRNTDTSTKSITGIRRKLIIGVDTSGSMSGVMPYVKQTLMAIANYMVELPPDTDICVVPFNTHASKAHFHNQTDHKAFVQWISNLEADGNTNLGDALAKMEEFVESNVYCAKLLLTDGFPTMGTVLSEKDAQDQYLSKHQGNWWSPLYCMGLGHDYNPALLKRLSFNGTYSHIQTEVDICATGSFPPFVSTLVDALLITHDIHTDVVARILGQVITTRYVNIQLVLPPNLLSGMGDFLVGERTDAKGRVMILPSGASYSWVIGADPSSFHGINGISVSVAFADLATKKLEVLETKLAMSSSKVLEKMPIEVHRQCCAARCGKLAQQLADTKFRDRDVLAEVNGYIEKWRADKTVSDLADQLHGLVLKHDEMSSESYAGAVSTQSANTTTMDTPYHATPAACVLERHLTSSGT